MRTRVPWVSGQRLYQCERHCCYWRWGVAISALFALAVACRVANDTVV